MGEVSDESFLEDTTSNAHVWENVRREGRMEPGHKSTSSVPKLSLGLIQYRSTSPIVAYLFCSERISGKHFGAPITRPTTTKIENTRGSISSMNIKMRSVLRTPRFLALPRKLNLQLHPETDQRGIRSDTCLVSNGQEIVVDVQGRKCLRDRLITPSVRSPLTTAVGVCQAVTHVEGQTVNRNSDI